jgi:hypothetical protein
MKLSQLVKYKNSLEFLNYETSRHEILVNVVDNAKAVAQMDVDFANIKHEMHLLGNEIIAKVALLDTHLQTFKDRLDNLINDYHADNYAKSTQTYHDDAAYRTPAAIFNHYKKTPLFSDVYCLELLLVRIKKYVSFQWPAVEFRPAFGAITTSLVASDPLYLVDTHRELFAEVEKLWTVDYQRRLRYNVFNESSNDMLHFLPNGQLGLAVAIDFFNNKPIEVISQYLTNLYPKLRAGGVVIFTYNDCDLPEGVANFEQSFYSYTPRSALVEMCLAVGYELVTHVNSDPGISWLEIKKPGVISSIKGGQALGKIESLL